MSHIKKILVLKEALEGKGVKSPAEQQNVINEAFTSSIIIGIHTACDGVFCKDAETKMICALDMWNEVTPIPGQFILSAAKDRMNRVKLGLLTKGRVDASEIYSAKDTDGNVVTFEDVKEEYYGLVAELTKEFRNGED